MQITNKTVFVTGGASGIGAACTKALLEKGAKVVVADVNEVQGTRLVQDLTKQHGQSRVIFVRCDVTDANNFRDAFQQAVTTFEHVDVMVNNAGILNENNWGKLLDVNLRGVIHGTELAVAHMRKDNGGQGGVIINMASVAGGSIFNTIFGAILLDAPDNYTKHILVCGVRFMAPFHEEFECYDVRKCYNIPLAYGGRSTKIANETDPVARFQNDLCAMTFSVPDIREQGVRYACICPQMIDTPIMNDMDKGKCRGYMDVVHQVISGERLSPKSVAEGLLSLIADSNDTLLEICAEGLVRKKIRVENA